MDLQDAVALALALALVAVAAGYVATRVWRTLTPPKGKSCNACDRGCSSAAVPPVVQIAAPRRGKP